jgi:hypothetical protein
MSSTASTAVEPPTNLRHLKSVPNPQDDNPVQSPSLPLPRRGRNSLEKRSFSSANKLPILEPSTSPLRRRFDFLLLWVLQTLTGLYLSIVAWKRFVVNTVWGVWYDWHAWPWCGRTMIAKDVGVLGKVPRHVAVILDQKRHVREYDADEMVRRAVDMATWCACAGISIVTFYEPTGSQPANDAA